MTYKELCDIAKKGKIGRLPGYDGYFKWSYADNELIFYNGDFQCTAKYLDIKNREDFHYII